MESNYGQPVINIKKMKMTMEEENMHPLNHI